MKPLRGWPSGVLSAAPALGVRMVLVSKLPVTRDSLALRLFGRGAVLSAAVTELLALPDDAWERRLIDMLVQWAAQITEISVKRDRDEQDFMANGNATYERWKREAEERGIEKGIEKGIEMGRRETLTRLFERRLSRALTEAEGEVLAQRSDALGPARLGEVVIDLSPDALSRWIADPSAR